MNTRQSRTLIGFILVLLYAAPVSLVQAQNFGNLVSRKKLVLVRKLPPTGHIEGTTVKVVATSSKTIQQDVAPDLATTLEAMLIRYDSRLRSEDTHPETLITCSITRARASVDRSALVCAVATVRAYRPGPTVRVRRSGPHAERLTVGCQGEAGSGSTRR